MCLSQDLITKEKIPKDIFSNMIIEFVDWIFLEENLFDLIQIDYEKAFKILYKLFVGNLASIIE